MSNKSGVSDQIISLPSGGGAQNGMGGKFAPDLFTGTGNFTIPITLPSGRNGFQPEISLVYSTGNGNGSFGLGWDLSIPGISRKTSKGVPLYDDSKDVFILSGAEDLVPVNVNGSRTQYRPRTEGLYAIIERVLDANNDYWEVKSKDGLVSIYGTRNSKGGDPGAIYDPEVTDNIFSWKLTKTRDPFGNRIVYTYKRDLQQTENRYWNQLYLSNIKYIDYQDAGGNERFLVNVRFEYEDRPDPFSTFRNNFEIRITKRCVRIIVETVTETNVLKSKTFELQYMQSPLNGASLLEEIQGIGHDGVETQPLPPVSFEYTEFNIENRDFFTLQGIELPVRSLANPDLEVVDLFGNGLPDIIQMNGTIRYWRNLGKGRFDNPRLMKNSPGGLTLEDPDVQMLDANGEGKADLMVNQVGLSGYYPLKFTGEWDRRSFQKYNVSPSFSLQDPEVRLYDLDGNGVTDALRTSTRFECFFQDSHEGWSRTLRVERKRIDTFPDVSFSDPRVKLADLTGDGLQDIVLVHDGNIEYWPYMGHGKWGKRIHMANSPRFPYGYDPKRILIGDVDGDGLADIVYVDHCKVLLWINQGGNRWSDLIEIDGTPPITDIDAVRLIDLLGSGIKGVLWSADATNFSRNHMYFLDFTGGTKPYLLHEMDNNIGAITRVDYKTSTNDYLADQQNRTTQWKTILPFPTQVVSKVEIIDVFSQGKLTTEYQYHHGHWDGAEREFRGFGRVDQYDTESFTEYNTAGLHGEGKAFLPVDTEFFSPPTLTKHWFHQGPLGEKFGDWYEADYSDEYWTWDPQKLERPTAMNIFLSALDRKTKRDALRTLRGRSLRTELYALDGSEREERPYTVTEHLHGVREDFLPNPTTEPDHQHIFFSHVLAQRSTQWERGNDPMTSFTFTEDYDAFGQPRKQTRIACPQGWKGLTDTAAEPFLATRSITEYANSINSLIYIKDRVCKTTEYEIVNDGLLTLLQLKNMPDNSGSLSIIRQQLHFYDDSAFTGRNYGEIGNYGALVRTEVLVLTEDILQDAYRSGNSILPLPKIPPFLDTSGPPLWSGEYPQAFRNQLPALVGYTFQTGGAGSPFARGYFSATVRRSYDFHTHPGGRGLVHIIRDPLGNDTTIQYADNDDYHLLPSRVTDINGLETQATYDYRVFQVTQVTDSNDNRTVYAYTPAGLLSGVAVMGKAGENVGDTLAQPSLKYEYDFLAFFNNSQPVSVRTIKREHHTNDTDIPLPKRNDTIESIEYSDGFGRLLQARARAEELTFGDYTFGDAGLDPDQSQPVGDALGQLRDPAAPPRVVITGWQVYDNKGRVVEKYEPFFSESWDYAAPTNAQRGQKITNYYDPRGQQVRTVFPNQSEQLFIQGVPTSLNDPLIFEPTPWEAYTYDPNDNAGRTHTAQSGVYQTHWNTPTSVKVDALGRTIETVQRNGVNPATQWYRTVSTYDIRGNLLTVTDPLNRLTFEHVYDLIDNALRIKNLDAGVRRRIQDAAGNLIEQRDSKGALILNSYDNLNRPIRKWARDKSGESVTLRERLIYGDTADSGLTTAQATKKNLLGNLYRHYDEAGLLEISSYDFKGNILEKSRKTIRDDVVLSVFAPAPVNWQVNAFRVEWQHPSGSNLDTYAAALLDATAFHTSLQYDALNRVKRMRYPEDVDGERKELLPAYNRAGALESVVMDNDNYVQHIAYNAKGQRAQIAYGNGVMTRHAYDPLTFRLLRTRTERFTQPNPLTYHPQGQALQEMGYKYDLHGNMLSLHDRAPGSGIAPQPDQIDREFTYDPIYRLLTATGRECDLPSSTPPWHDAPRCTDMTKTRSYTERYRYDAVGNMEQLQHQLNSGGFTRNFSLVANTNQLDTLQIGANTYQYQYDSNGNLIQENASRFFEWDHSDRLRSFHTQAGNKEPSIYTHYLYDAAGQRIKKITRKSGTNMNSTVYIDDMFEHHREQSGGTTRNNNHFHIMDDEKRIVIRRIGNPFPGDTGPSVQYHLGDHLGSSHLVVDETGAWTNREDFTPFGETSFGSFAKKRYRFTGKERDEESGLYYHEVRYYAPWLGRWTNTDPAGLVDGPNLYRYARDNPIAMNDPSGTQPAPAIDPETVKIITTALKRAAQAWGTASIVEGGSGTAVGVGGATASAAWIAIAQATLTTTAAILTLHLYMSRAGSIARYGNPYGIPSRDIAFPVLRVQRQHRLQQQLQRLLPNQQPQPKPQKQPKPDEDDEKLRNAFVVRGGIATPKQLQAGVAEHRAVPDITGFSVQSAPGMTIEELAAAGRFRNAQISVTTVGALLKVGIPVIPTPGQGFHNTAVTPMPLSNEQATAASSVFKQMPNPARVKR
jgi:RHS repeat-associated protein